MSYPGFSRITPQVALLLRLLICACTLSSCAANAGPPLDVEIEKSGLTAELQLFAKLPATGDLPRARLNVLREEPAGADRLFVNDLNGYLYTLDKTTREATTYLDLHDQFDELITSPGFASGHVSFAFHPEFADNGKLYTIHTEHPHDRGPTSTIMPPAGDVGQHSVLTEWTAEEPTANLFAGTHRELMRVGTPGRFHPMGDIGFNPSVGPEDPDYGNLYVAIGDGRSFGLGQSENLQRLDSVLGTILRINPDPTGEDLLGITGQYSVPLDNPWAIDGDDDTFGEIFAYGFRNPHRFSWDEETASMLVTDIGERTIEEVNLVRAGANYGWPKREGSFRVGGRSLPADDAGFTYPVAQYDRDDGRAISNGYVYRGAAVPELHGQYVFGEIPGGEIYYAKMSELIAADDGIPETVSPVSELQLLLDGQPMDFLDIVSQSLGENPGRTDLRFGLDATGELYLMSKQSGEIYHFVSPASPLDCNGDGVLSGADIDCSCGDLREELLDSLGLLAADLDQDGTVGFADFLLLSANFNVSADHNHGDIDCTGTTDFADFLILSSQFGSSTTAGVPEPTGHGLVIWWLAIVFARRELLAGRR